MTQSTPEVLSPHTITLGAEIAPVTFGETHSGQNGTYRVGVSIRGNEIPSLWRKKEPNETIKCTKNFPETWDYPWDYPCLTETSVPWASSLPSGSYWHEPWAVPLKSGYLTGTLWFFSSAGLLLCAIPYSPIPASSLYSASSQSYSPLISVVSPLHIISSFLSFVFLCILSALHSSVFSPLKPSLCLLTQRHLELCDLCLSLPWRGLYLQRLTRHLTGM